MTGSVHAECDFDVCIQRNGTPNLSTRNFESSQVPIVLWVLMLSFEYVDIQDLVRAPRLQ